MNPHAATALAADLSTYTPGSLTRVLGSRAMDAVRREQRIPALLAARASTDSVALQARGFLLRDELTDAEWDAALPTLGAAGATQAGIISGGYATCTITPHDHENTTILIASDWGALAGMTPPSDFVMPVGSATRTLSNIARYSAGQRVLDLGTGAGWHAIVAALAGATVVATDISQKALDFALFNAAMAGVDIDARRGSLFDPVSEKFDVIVSNPPFVLTPASVRDVVGTLEYRDGGDNILHRILAEIGEHMTEDGRAWMLANWEVRGDGHPASSVTTTRDTWVIVRDVIDPAAYAEMWLRDGSLTRGPEYEAAYEAWLTDFDVRDVSAIAFGYILLGPAGTRRKDDEIAGQIPAGLPCQDLVWDNMDLAHASDEEILSHQLVSQGLIEERFHTPGVESPWHITLSGEGRQYAVSGELAGFVGACDGGLTGKQIMDALAQILGENRAELASRIMPTVRQLVSDGLLARSGHSASERDRV